MVFINYTIDELNSNFAKELKSGLLEVIVPEKEYYPNFKNMPVIDHIFNDKPDRVRWRVKQNYDIVYLMSYCYGKGQYYLQVKLNIFKHLYSTFKKINFFGPLADYPQKLAR